MKVDLDLKELIAAEAKLNSVGRSLDDATVGRILFDAAKPLLIAETQEVPIGKKPVYESGVIVRGRNRGKPRDTTGSYARGGYLQRSLRILKVSPEGSEAGRVIVGASKRAGFAGWRAHFILGGTKNRKTRAGANRGSTTPNDYAGRAYNRTIDVVLSRFSTSAQTIIKRVIRTASK